MLTDNPEGTSEDVTTEPTTVDNPEVIQTEEITETGEDAINLDDYVSKEEHQEYRKMNDSRYENQVESLVKICKANPVVLKELSGEDEGLRKLRNSVVKRLYPEYKTWEEAQEYMNTLKDPKEEIDAKVKDEEIRLEAYLDGLARNDSEYKTEIVRRKFKDEFAVFAKNIDFTDRLFKTEKLVGMNTESTTQTKAPVSTTPKPVQPEPKKVEDVTEEDRALYESVKSTLNRR